MLASQLIDKYEAFCPQELSLDGDISGLQIGTLNKPISRVLVALDVRESTVAEAIEQEVDLIIVKHAPIFKPLKDLVADRAQTQIYLDLIKHDIAVYVSHTNIDVVEGGLNDWFCELLGLTETEFLTPTVEGRGIGRVGNLPETSLADLAVKVKKVFDLDSVRLVTYANPHSQLISRVAICGGSGQGFYPDALAKGAQVFITGDIYYHTAQDMLTEGLLAIDPGHHIEVLFAEKIAELLSRCCRENDWQVTILASQALTNPFKIL